MTTTISISSGVIVEGDSNNQLVFTVSLSEPLTQDITLNYSTLNGSATSGADYTAVSNAPLVFKAGETVKTISITILKREPKEKPSTPPPLKSTQVHLERQTSHSSKGDAAAIQPILSIKEYYLH